MNPTQNSLRFRMEKMGGMRALGLRILALALLGLLAAGARGQTGTVWTQMTDTAPWRGRSIYVTEYHGKLWLDIYVPGPSSGSDERWSSADGIQWTRVNDSHPWVWPSRPFVFQDKLWVAGAFEDRRLWNSTDGVHWTLINSQTPVATHDPQAMAVYNGKIWLIDKTRPGIWNSSDGITWKLLTSWTWSTPGIPMTYGVSNVYTTHVFNGKLWLMNSYQSSANYSDVWNTSDGVTWTKIADRQRWSLNWGASAVYGGRLWVLGGLDHSDVWSSRDGAQWECVIAQAPWFRPSNRPISLVVFKNLLMLMNGGAEDLDSGPSEVWHWGYPPGAPVVKPYANATATAGRAFTSLAPPLSQGSNPYTWTLVGGPAGMTINPLTGAVTWPNPLLGAKAYPIRQRITNAAGSAELNWWLTVAPLVPLNISVPAFTNQTQVRLYWNPVPGATSYTIQSDDAVDFSTPLASSSINTSAQDQKLGQTMSGLSEDRTYWFHVLAYKQGQLLTASRPTACLRDTRFPVGAVTTPPQPIPDTVLLNFAMQDPGSAASGLHQMRFSLDGRRWTPWEPWQIFKALPVKRGGALTIHSQMTDRAGNIRYLATPATALTPTPQAIFVDGANVAAPWSGTIDHPYRKIQDALNAAATGQTIIVAPGAYLENINFKGKNVVLRSAAPQSQQVVKATLIDGQAQASVVTFGGTETPTARLEGFTIMHGQSQYGAGVNGNNTHAAIQNNRIVYNHAFSSYSTTSGDVINTFETGYGGGLARCNGLIQNNIVAFNDAASQVHYSKSGSREGWPPIQPPYHYYYYTFQGGALYQCGGTIQNNTFFSNFTLDATATDIYRCYGSLKNNIIVATGFDSVTAPRISFSAVPSATGTGQRNLVLTDAGLVDPANENFALKSTSPCIDAGCRTTATRDIDNEARGYNGSSAPRGDGSDFDIGADEYRPAS